MSVNRIFIKVLVLFNLLLFILFLLCCSTVKNSVQTSWKRVLQALDRSKTSTTSRSWNTISSLQNPTFGPWCEMYYFTLLCFRSWFLNVNEGWELVICGQAVGPMALKLYVEWCSLNHFLNLFTQQNNVFRIDNVVICSSRDNNQ